MTFQKPKNPKPQIPVLTERKAKEILEIIVKEHFDREEKKSKAFEKVDENTSRHFSNLLTFNYYLLSIITACIGFSITLTVNQKFSLPDFMIIVSLILWLISFYMGIVTIHRNAKITSAFSYYLLGETLKIEELTTSYKKLSDDLRKESAITQKSPMLYFILGVAVFMIWYVFKIFTN